MNCHRAIAYWPPKAALLLAAALCLGAATAANADDIADVRATVALEGKLFDTRDATPAARVYEARRCVAHRARDDHGRTPEIGSPIAPPLKASP
jgi:hypothetical protein